MNFYSGEGMVRNFPFLEVSKKRRVLMAVAQPGRVKPSGSRALTHIGTILRGGGFVVAPTKARYQLGTR